VGELTTYYFRSDTMRTCLYLVGVCVAVLGAQSRFLPSASDFPLLTAAGSFNEPSYGSPHASPLLFQESSHSPVQQFRPHNAQRRGDDSGDPGQFFATNTDPLHTSDTLQRLSVHGGGRDVSPVRDVEQPPHHRSRNAVDEHGHKFRYTAASVVYTDKSYYDPWGGAQEVFGEHKYRNELNAILRGPVERGPYRSRY